MDLIIELDEALSLNELRSGAAASHLTLAGVLTD
jgi:hypothetical protein